MLKIKKILNSLHTPKWLFILLCIVFIIRIPSFFEPYSYGDEMIYLTLGEAIRRGIPLYKSIHDNKPPLLYLMAAISGNLFWFKTLLSMWIIVTIYIFWRLVEYLFPKRNFAQISATIIFSIFTSLPLLEGNIVNAELFLIGPTILSFYILLSKKITNKILFLSGLLFSVSILFKVPAIFDVPTIIFFWIVSLEKIDKKSFSKIIKNTSYLFLGLITPICISLIYYFKIGALKEYFIAAFMQNVGYLSSWRPDVANKSLLIKNLPLLIRGLIVLIGISVLYWRKRFLSKKFIFATSWLLFSLFAATLSERPYPHYLVQCIAPISILLTILLTQRSIEQVYTIIPLALTFLVPVYYHYWYYPSLPYYQRFINLITKKISRDEYLSSFGSQVPRNYKIAELIVTSTKKNEKVFVWGDSPPIYALTKRFPPGKYVAEYHIKDFSNEAETIRVLKNNLPSLIIILPGSPNFPSLQNFLNSNFALFETIDGAEIWKLLNPKVRALLS